MMWFSGRVFFSGALLFSCVFLCGCSNEDKRTAVHGKVSWKGQPPALQGLRISFIGSDNKSVTALVDLNGEYNATVLSGDNLVAVSWQPPDDQNPHRSAKPKSPGERASNPDPKDLPASPIPLRYANPATSGLTCTIEADKPNTFNVDLVD